MNSSDSRVEVALPSDQNYLHGLWVTAASLAVYLDPSVVLSITVLDGGIADAAFSDFADMVCKFHRQTVFSRIKVNEESFADLPCWSGNRMTYARLLLPAKCPHIDHILYCDTDFLWTTDVSRLWRLRDDHVALQGCLDHPHTIEEDVEWFEENGLELPTEHYVGGGMLLINLRLFREMKVVENAVDFLKQHPNVRFADQSAYNYILQRDIKLLDQRWHILSRFVTDELILSGCGIHFPCEKAWACLRSRSDVITDFKLFWVEIYAWLTGRSVWMVLREWHPAYKILSRRLMFLVCASRMKKCVFCLLRKIGMSGTALKLDIWCHRLDYKSLLKMVQRGCVTQ